MVCKRPLDSSILNLRKDIGLTLYFIAKSMPPLDLILVNGIREITGPYLGLKWFISFIHRVLNKCILTFKILNNFLLFTGKVQFDAKKKNADKKHMISKSSK